MKKFTTIIMATVTAMGLISMVSLASAEEQTTDAKPIPEKASPQKAEKSVSKNSDAKKATDKVQKSPKGRGSRALAQFKKMDKDNNNLVSKTEFLDFQSLIFARKDRNKDGDLSPAELSPTLAKVTQVIKK